MEIESVCIYCGSSMGSEPVFQQIAHKTGVYLAKHSIRLVYGGGNCGLMGAVADATLSAGGEVIGVIPEDLMDKELGHPGIQKLEVVKNMHERKRRMAGLADAFIALPGGIGTLEEIFEVYTWKQLNFHKKPCAFLNANGYYTHLLTFLKQSVESGFLNAKHMDALIVENSIDLVMQRIMSHQHDMELKW